MERRVLFALIDYRDISNRDRPGCWFNKSICGLLIDTGSKQPCWINTHRVAEFLLYRVVVGQVDVIVRGKARAVNGSLSKVLNEHIAFCILLVEAVDTYLLRVHSVCNGSAVDIIRVNVQHATEKQTLRVGKLHECFFLPVLSEVGNDLFHESDHLFLCRYL